MRSQIRRASVTRAGPGEESVSLSVKIHTERIHMHLSMHNWMRAEPLQRTVERLADCGYDAIQIVGEPRAYSDRADTRAILSARGIACDGAVTMMVQGRNLLAAEAHVREESVAYVKECVDLVADLGGHELTVVPGQVGQTAPAAPAEQEWQWAVASLQTVYEYAGPKRVQLGIEPLNRYETYFLNRGAQALALAEAVGPECGVCLDAFHINIEEADPLSAIRHAAPRLVDFHIADTNRLAAGWGHHDWPTIIDTLRGAGYNGPLTVEFVPLIDRTPANPYPESLETENVARSDDRQTRVEDHASDIVNDEFYTRLARATAETLRPLITDDEARVA